MFARSERLPLSAGSSHASCTRGQSHTHRSLACSFSHLHPRPRPYSEATVFEMAATVASPISGHIRAYRHRNQENHHPRAATSQTTSESSIKVLYHPTGSCRTRGDLGGHKRRKARTVGTGASCTSVNSSSERPRRSSSGTCPAIAVCAGGASADWAEGAPPPRSPPPPRHASTEPALFSPDVKWGMGHSHNKSTFGFQSCVH